MNTPPRRKGYEHASYKAHRRQFWIQIMAPVLLGAVLFVIAPAVVWASRFGGAGNVGRWSAISTMWLLLPVMIALVVLFIVLVTVIFLLVQANSRLPTYSRQVQRWADAAALGTQRAAGMVRKPVLAIRAAGNAAKAQFRRLRERA